MNAQRVNVKFSTLRNVLGLPETAQIGEVRPSATAYGMFEMDISHSALPQCVEGQSNQPISLEDAVDRINRALRPGA